MIFIVLALFATAHTPNGIAESTKIIFVPFLSEKNALICAGFVYEIKNANCFEARKKIETSQIDTLLVES